MSEAEKNVLCMYNKLPHALQAWLLSTLSKLIDDAGKKYSAGDEKGQLLH